jgi:hypothetical protein
MDSHCVESEESEMGGLCVANNLAPSINRALQSNATCDETPEQQRAVISLKMSIRTFINAPASQTKDWPARNKKNTIANMAGMRHQQFWLKG